MSDVYDVVVIGGGPAGYVGAIRASQLGARAALIECGELGGTCLNRGCIPTKTLLHSAAFYRQVKAASRFGITLPGDPQLDLVGLRERKQHVVDKLVSGIHALLQAHKVEVIRGRARLAGPERVVVTLADGTERVLSYKNLLVAAGTEPATLPVVAGLPAGAVLDSTSGLNLDSIPGRLLIIGGGFIGVEFASIYSGLGSAVTVVEAGPRVLAGADSEIVRALVKDLTAQGVQFHTGTQIAHLRALPSGEIEVTLRSEDGTVQPFPVDRVLVAVGRRANTEGLGLEAAGVALAREFIQVDESGRTSRPGIWAAGDVTGPPLLAHRASAQAVNAVEAMLGHPPTHNLGLVPSCVYTDPEIAMIGMTEDEVKAKGIPYRVGRFPFAANGKALSAGEERGFVKVIIAEADDEILGVHILGPHASALIGEAVIGMSMEATAADFIAAIHPHPTLTEAIPEAVLDSAGLAIHKAGRRRPSMS